jgi:hypothetical protein
MREAAIVWTTPTAIGEAYFGFNEDDPRVKREVRRSPPRSWTRM